MHTFHKASQLWNEQTQKGPRLLLTKVPFNRLSPVEYLPFRSSPFIRCFVTSLRDFHKFGQFTGDIPNTSHHERMQRSRNSPLGVKIFAIVVFLWMQLLLFSPVTWRGFFVLNRRALHKRQNLQCGRRPFVCGEFLTLGLTSKQSDALL